MIEQIKIQNIRMIMIRAKGDFFCSGMDLSEFEKNNNQSKMDEAVDKYAQLLLRFYQSHKPIISLVQGDVLAGGVGIICASDIVVSTTKVTVQLSEVFFGLIPANVSALPIISSSFSTTS